jgi:mgtE-like transporter
VDRSRRRLPPAPRVPEPLLRLGRTLGLPVSETASYWRQESRSIRMGSAALAVGLLATLIAGTVLGTARETLAASPGLLVLIPAAIGMRGSIFGALAARLSTGILTGEYTRELSRTTFLGRQVEAVGVLSVTTATMAGVLAWVIATGLGLPTIPLLDLVAVSLVGGLLSSVALLAVTLAIARTADDQGWNMDDVGAPVITATGDLITLPSLLLAALLLRVEPVALTLGGIGLVAGAVTAVLGWRHDHPGVRRTIRESMVVLTLAVTLQVFAGTVIESRVERFLAVPALLVLIPPFVAACGSLGGMLASRLSSKLHIGLIEPRRLPGRIARLDGSLIVLLGVLAFTGVGAVGWLAALATGLTPPSPLVLVGLSLTGGALAIVLLMAVAYTAATTTFRFGLDPDNHGIPIVTAAMDLLGILCLVAAMALTRVG